MKRAEEGARKPRTAILGAALIAALISLSQIANATTAYYVARNSVYVRSHPGGYAMGRLYRDQRMDIQYVDSDGWAYGYAYGYVNRCVWAQFREHNTVNFRTNGTTVSTKCRDQDRYLYPAEYTNGEVWGANDGEVYFLPRATSMWDNWAWGTRWGNHYYQGDAPAGSLWKIRYTTADGGGVMARPCHWTGDWLTSTCDSNWMFIQRSAIDTIHCGYLSPGERLDRGQTLNSCDGRFSLAMQTDGNLVLYQNPGGALWSTGTPGTGGNTAIMQTDGNLVLYDAYWRPVWNSGTWGQSGAWLAIQNDGNLVVYSPSGLPLWVSNTCCR